MEISLSFNTTSALKPSLSFLSGKHTLLTSSSSVRLRNALRQNQGDLLNMGSIHMICSRRTGGDSGPQTHGEPAEIVLRRNDEGLDPDIKRCRFTCATSLLLQH